MTTNQPNNFGLQWGNSQTSGNQTTGSSWGAASNFGRPTMGGSNTFGSTFQSSQPGQNTSNLPVSQNTSGNNPFGSSSLQVQTTNPQATSGFGQPSSFGAPNVNMGNSFGQARQNTSTTGFGFSPSQNASSMNLSQGFQQAQGNQATGGLSFGSASSNNASVNQTPFGQTNNTQMGRIGGFGSNAFGSIGNANQTNTGFSFGQGNKPGGQSNPPFGFGNTQVGASAGINQVGSGFSRPSTGFGTSTSGQFNLATSTSMQGTSGFGGNSQTATANSFMQSGGGKPFPFGANASSGSTGNLFGQAGAQPVSSTGNAFGSLQSQTQTGFGGLNQQQGGGLFGTSAPSTFGQPMGNQSTGGFQFGAPASGGPSTSLFGQQTGAQTKAPSAPFGQVFGSNAQNSVSSTQFGTTQGNAQQGGFGPGQSIQNNSLQLPSATQSRPFSFGLTPGVSTQQPVNQIQSLGSQSLGMGGTGLGSSVTSTPGGLFGLGKPNAQAPTSTLPGASSISSQQTAFGSNAGTFSNPSLGPNALPGSKSAVVFGANQANQNQIGAATLPTSAPFNSQSSTGSLSFPSSVSGVQPTTNFSIPAVGTSIQSSQETEKSKSISGDASLFAIDKSIDIAQQSQGLRSEYAFIDKDEFERFHPLMQKLLILDNRACVSHPEYSSRGFLIEQCDEEKSREMRSAMKQENADIQDAVFPDSIRLEWTKCAKEAIQIEENVCPIPCASSHVLEKRCQLHKEEILKNRSELQSLLNDLDNAKKSAILDQQWLDEHCVETRLKIYTEALSLQKELLMLRNKDDVLTAKENELHIFVNEIQSVLQGNRSVESMKKYCCSPEFFGKLCGNGPLSEIVDGISSSIKNHTNFVLEKLEPPPVSDLDDSHSTMEVLDSLESIREGTNTVLELLDADKKIIKSIENGKKP